jgi:hypothetical protein
VIFKHTITISDEMGQSPESEPSLHITTAERSINDLKQWEMMSYSIVPYDWWLSITIYKLGSHSGNSQETGVKQHIFNA